MASSSGSIAPTITAPVYKATPAVGLNKFIYAQRGLPIRYASLRLKEVRATDE
jgi:hypothetical protein